MSVDDSVAAFTASRAALLEDTALVGRAFIDRYTALVDAWVQARFTTAAGPPSDGMALLAIGGYGRRELCPGSDLDLLLVHRGNRAVDGIAEELWYPMWDAGLHVGHAVRTPDEAIDLARADLDSATALLTARHLAGDAALSRSLAASAEVSWRRGAATSAGALRASVVARHAAKGEVAFLLEPDLKVGRGGLRDVQALAWLEALLPGELAFDHAAVAGAYEHLLAMRVELHRRNRGRGDVLLLQEQDAVAAALGLDDADALLAEVAGAARTITWNADEVWEQIDGRRIGALSGRPRRFGRRQRGDRGTPPAADGVEVSGGRMSLPAGAEVDGSPEAVFDLAASTAERGLRLGRDTLVRLAGAWKGVADPWPARAREAFLRLLLSGPGLVPVMEDLDQHGLWVALLPEWQRVRNRPQRNAYHRFTVDRHLVETCAGVAAVAGRVARPDLLALAALFHDIGKGGAGDHSIRGAGLAAQIVRRMGLPAADEKTVETLVRHHLLLPEVATRRDLADPATIAHVVAIVGDGATLAALAALAEVDGLATGPAAWSTWKAQLIADLVRRVHARLVGEADDGAPVDDFPTPPEQALLAARRRCILTEGSVLTVVAPDRPGLFSRVAGVLSLHGLQVLGAGARSDDAGWALERFNVATAGAGRGWTSRPEERWDAVRADLDRVLAGRLALHARVAERARAYRPAGGGDAGVPARVVVDNDASDVATVLEVHAPDSVGLLYRITAALADLELDLRTARVATLGDHVVDVFYVRDAAGAKVTDTDHLAEVERAVLFAIEQH